MSKLAHSDEKSMRRIEAEELTRHGDAIWVKHDCPNLECRNNKLVAGYEVGVFCPDCDWSL